LWRWLEKSRADSHAQESSALPGEEHGQDNLFRLESLEPRLLLSADPVLGELARWVADDGQSSDAENIAVIIQEIDQATATAVTAGNGSDQSARSGVTVAWPRGWEVAADKSGINETAKQIRFSASGHDWFVNDGKDSGHGRVDLWSLVTDLVEQAFDNAAADENDSQASDDGPSKDGSQSEGKVAAVADSISSEDGGQSDDGVAAVTDSMSSEQLNVLLEKAIDVLSTTSPDGDLADRLGDLTIQVADLADGVIAKIQGNVILIDITAAGHGWFLDSLYQQISDVRETQLSVDGGVAGDDAAADKQQAASDQAGPAELSHGQAAAPADPQIMLAAPDLGEGGGSSENWQPATAHQEGRSSRDSGVVADETPDPAVALDQFQNQQNPIPGSGSGDSSIAPANSPSDLLEKVLDLVGLATGLRGEVEAGEDVSDLVVGLVVASHRLQESNRSLRNELRKGNNRSASGEDAGQSHVSKTTESEVTTIGEGGEDAAPRGPPAIEEIQTITEDNVSDTVQGLPAVSLYYDETVPETASSDTVLPRAPPVDSEMPRAPPTVADMPRAPPADADTTDYLLFDGDAVTATDTTNALTSEQLEAHFQQALLFWSEALLSADQLDRLNALTARISDLSGGILGEAQGETLYVDSDAAGHGWFVDTTPADNSEFGISLDGSRLLAGAGSAAEGRVDLLTVLLHEIGHALGFDHDSGLAVMAEVLGTGQRVVPGEPGTATLPPQSPDTVSAALLIGGTIDLSTATAVDPALGITITINDAGQVSVSGSVADDVSDAPKTSVMRPISRPLPAAPGKTP